MLGKGRFLWVVGLWTFPCFTALAQVQTLGFTLTGGKKKVELPIEIHSNLVVLPVVLNGQLPLKFILDTGVRTAILTEKAYTDILELPYVRKYTLSGPGGEKLINAYVTNNVTLDIPPHVQGRGHALLVLEKDYLELRNYLGTDVHGILGYELFSRFIVEIDYEKKMLTLSSPERFRPGRRYYGIPMKIEDTKPFIFTDVQISDSSRLTLKLLVDSGASHGLFLDPSSDSGIAIPPRHVYGTVGRGLGGSITGYIARIPALSLGKYTVGQPIVNFPDPDSYYDTLGQIRRSFRNGSLGGEILSRFHVVFDFSRERLYIRKNSEFKKGFYYNLSGLTVRARGAQLKRFEVMEVRPGSAGSKADIQVGDVIMGIDGLASRVLSLSDVNALLSSKEGKKIKLEIYREGKMLKRQMILESPI